MDIEECREYNYTYNFRNGERFHLHKWDEDCYELELAGGHITLDRQQYVKLIKELEFALLVKVSDKEGWDYTK